MKKPQRFASVWDALADTPEQAANLTARSDLMIQIAEIVKKNGVTQPRINDLLRGRIERFSLDALVNLATALGRKVRVDIQAA